MQTLQLFTATKPPDFTATKPPDFRAVGSPTWCRVCARRPGWASTLSHAFAAACASASVARRSFSVTISVLYLELCSLRRYWAATPRWACS